MTRDHALIDELLAIRALGGLDGDEADLLEHEMAAHGDCDECRRLEAEHAEVAGMLALALDPRPVDEAVADRIVAQPQKGQEPDPAAAPPADELSGRRDVRLGRWQAAFGVAAAVALVLAFVLATRPQGGIQVPGTIVAFQGASGQGASGELAMAYTPGERGALVWGAGLPNPGSGKVYEVWMIEGGNPVRGACLAPTDGAVATYLDTDLSSAELMAVTVESPDCPSAPTTQPVFTAELT
jgi:hypothetical protein